MSYMIVKHVAMSGIAACVSSLVEENRTLEY